MKLILRFVSSQIKLRVMDSFCRGHPAPMSESDSDSNPPETKVNTDGSVAIEAAAR